MKFSSVRFVFCFFFCKATKLKYGGSPKTRVLSWSETICSNFVGSSLLWEGFSIRLIRKSLLVNWSRKRFRAVWEQRLSNESQRRREKWLSFHFSRGQNRKSFPSVFLCYETKRKTLATQAKPFAIFYRRWVYGWTASAFGIKISCMRNDRIHTCYHQVLFIEIIAELRAACGQSPIAKEMW